MSTNNNSKKEDNCILKNMKGAIVRAHQLNNPRAISKDFAAGCGVPENALESWTTWVKLLHEAVKPWVAKFNDKDIEDAELQALYGKVFPILRQLIRVDKTALFIRESDAVRICGFAAKHGKSAKGSVDVEVGEKAFRKEIETMLGIRLAQSQVLTEKEYETITKYEATETNLEKAQNKLNGTERNGVQVPGLTEKLEGVKKTLEDMKGLVGAKDVSEEELLDKYPVLAGYVKAVKDMESDITNTEKRIKDAEAYLKEKKSAYTEVMAKINEIK